MEESVDKYRFGVVGGVGSRLEAKIGAVASVAETIADAVRRDSGIDSVNIRSRRSSESEITRKQHQL